MLVACAREQDARQPDDSGGARQDTGFKRPEQRPIREVPPLTRPDACPGPIQPIVATMMVTRAATASANSVRR